MKKKLLVIALVVAFVLAFASVAFAADEFVKGFNKNLELYPNWIGVDAQNLPSTMPIFTYSGTEGAATHINEIVWVEVPCDTDRDGKRDRVSLWIRRPVTQPGFLCPVVMEFSPYHAGTVGYSRLSAQINSTDPHVRAMAETFKYHDNYPISIAANPATTYLKYGDVKAKVTEAWDTVWWQNGAFSVNSWYTGAPKGTVPPATVPSTIGTAGGTAAGAWRNGTSAVSPPSRWSHYFVRGYAMVYGQLLGNRDCTGITNSLHVEEWLSAAAACKWFNGEAKGFTTRDGDVEVIADWANGHVALDGTSYPGTTPTIAAMAGVKGVKAIMPEAHVASWYEYYRSGGGLHSPGGYGGEDMNLHSSFNFSRFNADSTSGIPPAAGPKFDLAAQQAYVETQQYMMLNQDRITGDYNEHWDYRNLTRAYGKIAPDVGILQTSGIMDWNVMPRHSFQALQSFRDNFKGTHKLVCGMTAHASQNDRSVKGTDGVERGMLKWYLMFLDKYMLGLDNKVDELMYDVNIPNFITGEMEGYNYDPAKEERGTIFPGTKYQKVYLTEGPAGKAGRLSYLPPTPSVMHFADLDILAQLNEPTPQGATALSAANKTTIPNSSDGNMRVNNNQAVFAEDRVVGLNRTTTSYGTGNTILTHIDTTVKGRLMYISEPLTARLTLSGTPVVHLNAAPDRGSGNLTVALLEIGRKSYVGPGAIYGLLYPTRSPDAISVSTTGSYNQFPAENGASAVSATRYANPIGNQAANYKWVTWGHTDVQNPSYDKKAWFQVPEQNYVPNYYFQTTAIVPGDYYDYVVELNPYNYTFEAGNQIAVLVFGTDANFSPLLTAECTAEFDVKLGSGTYIDIPLKEVTAVSAEVTITAGSGVVASGNTIDITYSISGNTGGFATFDLDLPFDKAVYTPVSVTAGPMLAGGTFTSDIGADSLNVQYSSFNTTGNGLLFTVTYKFGSGAAVDKFAGATDIVVNSYTISPFTTSIAQSVKVKTVSGSLTAKTYMVYLTNSRIVNNELLVDVMITGALNYTQLQADITFKTDQLAYVGAVNPTGVISTCTSPASGKVSLRSVPSTNMVIGAPCSSVPVYTLKFKKAGTYTGPVTLQIPTVTVSAPAGYLGATFVGPAFSTNI